MFPAVGFLTPTYLGVLMTKLTLNLFVREDKLWAECCTAAVQGLSNSLESPDSISDRAAKISDQFVRGLRGRWPGETQKDIGG